MELGIYDIIKGVIVTPKSIVLQKSQGKFTFNVNKNANKIQVKRAIEEIWNVKVDTVRTVNLHGKLKRVKRKTYRKSDVKKAIITLKEGYSISLPHQYESMGVSSAANTIQGGE